MKICMVTMHGCIRVWKYAWMLKNNTDYEVYLMADRESMGWNIYDGFSKYLNKEMFQNQIKMYDKFVDIFHVHNEPDNLVTWVREVSDKPIIYDCHDLQHLRTLEEPDIDELAAFELADYVIHVGEHLAAAAEKMHGEHEHSVIKSWVNEKFFAKNPVAPCWKSICYEGGVTDESSIDGLWSYRYYVPMVGNFRNQGYIVTIYSASMEALPEHQRAGATVINNLPYPELMKTLQIHAMGFVGACINVPIMQNAVPNKLFEYMSQGVVPVVHWGDKAWEQIKEYDIGFNLKDITNLKKELVGLRRKRKNLLDARWNFVFENQQDEILEIYKNVIA